MEEAYPWEVVTIYYGLIPFAEPQQGLVAHSAQSSIIVASVLTGTCSDQDHLGSVSWFGDTSTGIPRVTEIRFNGNHKL